MQSAQKRCDGFVLRRVHSSIVLLFGAKKGLYEVHKVLPGPQDVISPSEAPLGPLSLPQTLMLSEALKGSERLPQALQGPLSPS